jgi:hypothetical protein
MLSQKNQALDIWSLLQVSQVARRLNIGGSPKIKTGRIGAISITYLNWALIELLILYHKNIFTWTISGQNLKIKKVRKFIDLQTQYISGAEGQNRIANTGIFSLLKQFHCFLYCYVMLLLYLYYHSIPFIGTASNGQLDTKRVNFLDAGSQHSNAVLLAACR